MINTSALMRQYHSHYSTYLHSTNLIHPGVHAPIVNPLLRLNLCIPYSVYGYSQLQLQYSFVVKFSEYYLDALQKRTDSA